ncbi:phosphoribosylpyrophosphate synthetase [Acanthamoeba castellanii str. Neff]|uniref:ribose-phosphate diphosphokinase n=1 Tax=Acanthamoeba castellanii (strain ATCC 30010 / Neff) TaxID=1257118 RepID=L8H993_ACACF|nr:phosphoribosylpyrophosphate synthetase [Acanthamoeba castellanii str. Neff]ELR21006.1 phosphoribosylpyrophosphate synthetase [Acanthamoeba castellanii str. Neff]
MEQGRHADDETSGYVVRVLMGNANPKLGRDIAEALGERLSDCEIAKFADGEINMQIKENIRGADVYTIKLSSAKRITAVIPYYGYGRQDRKTRPRVPISASAVAQLIEAMGADRVVTVDLHCGQIQGFFHHTPVDNLFAESEFIDTLRSKYPDPSDVVIVSPDAGGVMRARRMADTLHVENVATILKRRGKANVVDSMQIVGSVAGKRCVIVDDIIDTAGTLCKAAELLKDNGATDVIACATHGVFSDCAMDRLNASCLSAVYVSDSIPQEHNKQRCDRLHVLSIAPLLARAIRRVHDEKSLSVLFPHT